MSYVTPLLSIKFKLGTWTLSLARPTSLSSDPLLGELPPCADLRQLERGSLAEPPSLRKSETWANTANLCQILWIDHSYTATREERIRHEKSWKLSLNAEGVQGPLNLRSAIKEAKQTCKRLYQEHTAITGSGNKPIPPEQQVRQRRDQQFEGLEEHAYRLGASTGWRYYPSSTTHSSSSSSSRWQPSSDVWSPWNWDSWKSSSWSEQ